LVKGVAKKELGERGGKVVDREVEVGSLIEGEVEERGWEVIDCRIEPRTQNQLGERRWESIQHSISPIIQEGEAGEGTGGPYWDRPVGAKNEVLERRGEGDVELLKEKTWEGEVGEGRRERGDGTVEVPAQGKVG
jgi:hypothetical protein